MSKYFNTVERKIQRVTRENDDAFLTEIAALEDQVKADSLAFANDPETPAKIKQDIDKIINYWEVRLGNRKGSNKGAEEVLLCRYSKLCDFLHGYWRDLAKIKLVTRYGLIKDNPGHVVRAQAAFEKRKKKK